VVEGSGQLMDNMATSEVEERDWDQLADELVEYPFRVNNSL